MKSVLYSICFILLAASLTGCRTLNSYDDRELMSLVTTIVITALFIVLAVNSNLLREQVNDCNVFEAKGEKLQQKQTSRITLKEPFSLSKVQFGLWTVIISSSYIYLSLCKGDCADVPVNKTALVLLGIYSGLAVASTFINKREINDNIPRHQNTPSRGFFIDILSDSNGVSLHRFQNVVWTAIAAIVYFYKLAEIKTGCALPELSDTLLALTGLSTATQLVLSSKENDPPVNQPYNAQVASSQMNSVLVADSPTAEKL